MVMKNIEMLKEKFGDMLIFKDDTVLGVCECRGKGFNDGMNSCSGLASIISFEGSMAEYTNNVKYVPCSRIQSINNLNFEKGS